MHAFARIAEYARSVCDGVACVARILGECEGACTTKVMLIKDLQVLNSRSSCHSTCFHSLASMYILYKLSPSFSSFATIIVN